MTTGPASPFVAPGAYSPRVPPLLPSTAHVWRASLDVGEDDLARCRSLLARDERARADRYLRPVHGARFAVARALTRSLLGAYCGVPAAKLAFALGPHGKPALDPAASDGLEFSVSHTGGWVAVAVTREGPLGVDIEERRGDVDLEAVARFSFSPEEQAALAAVPAGSRREAFYACWSRKEAYIKAIGMGLALPLDAFTVSLGESAKPALLTSRLRPSDPSFWSMASFEAAPDVQGALATGPRVATVDWFTRAPQSPLT